MSVSFSASVFVQYTKILSLKDSLTRDVLYSLQITIYISIIFSYIHFN